MKELQQGLTAQFQEVWPDHLVDEPPVVNQIRTEALRESEARFRALFEQAGAGMAIVDLNYQFLQVNLTFSSIFGYQAEELQRRTFCDLSSAQEGEASTCETQWLLMDSNLTHSLEQPYVRKDGFTIWVKVTVSQVRDNWGNALYYLAVVEDISDRKLAEARLQAELAEKKLLIREMHHRIKNNLYIAKSLLDIQSRQMGDERFDELIVASQRRLEVMALIHKKLYQSDTIATMNFALLIQELVDSLLSVSHSNPNLVQVVMNVQPLELKVETAIPCGLILNELVTNTLKHAFSDNRPGKITIEFHQGIDEQLHLNIRDNGIGMPEKFNLMQASSLGMRLVYLLARQLNARLEVNSDCGTQFCLTFTPSI